MADLRPLSNPEFGVKVGLLMAWIGLLALAIEFGVGAIVPSIAHAPVGSWVTYWTMANLSIMFAGGMVAILFGGIRLWLEMRR